MSFKDLMPFMGAIRRERYRKLHPPKMPVLHKPTAEQLEQIRQICAQAKDGKLTVEQQEEIKRIWEGKPSKEEIKKLFEAAAKNAESQGSRKMSKRR